VLTPRYLSWLFAAALAAAGVVVWLLPHLQGRPPAPPAAVGPSDSDLRPVPLGQTEQRTLVDEDGSARVWTLTKQEVPREQLDDMVLPAADPQPAAVSPEATAKARALDATAVESWKHGDVKGALELFEAAAQADPSHVRTRSDYGRLLTLMGAYEKALPHLQRAAELEPENPQVWVDLLSYYERNTLLERALYARQRAENLAKGRKLERDPSGLWVLEGESLLP
jgi:tetratricopeptide (TPR) repeat protein